MILYFSATGNSRYAAQRLAAALNDRAVSIIDSDGEIALRRGERLGVVTPTYAWELPEHVRRFLKNAQFTAEGDLRYHARRFRDGNPSPAQAEGRSGQRAVQHPLSRHLDADV